MKLLLTITTAILLSITAINADELNAQQRNELGAIMSKVMEQIKANPNMSDEEQEALTLKAMSGSKMMQDRLQNQKKELPNVLKVMKNYRSCISSANSKDDAKVCRKKSDILAQKLKLDSEFNENEAFVWDKKQMVSEMDEEIKDLENALPCIQKAQDMSDMMKCHGMQ